jgi:ubiquinone/menaquinone biosynthesis C-methylase UbiE
MNKSSVYLERWCAEEYDKDRFDGAFGRFLQDHEVETFLSMIDGFGGPILDVGTGTGKLSLPFLATSREVISLDASLEMLRLARVKARTKGVALKPIICDASCLCFQENVFPCVVSSRVLMHLADWKNALAELCRVAQSAVVLDFPPRASFAGLESFFSKLKMLFPPETRTYQAFSTRAIRRELQRHGFQISEEKRTYFLPVAFHRWLDRPRLSSRLEAMFAALGLTGKFGAPVTLKAVKRNTGGGYEDTCYRGNRFYWESSHTLSA